MVFMMNKCKYCGVQIMDPVPICPLCNCALECEQIQMSGRYPDVHMKQQKLHLALRIYLTAAILIEGFLIYANVHWHSKYMWSVITGAALFYAYYVMKVSVSHTAGYRSRVIGLTFFATAYIVLTDVICGFQGWSLNYMLPGSLIFMNIAVVVLIFVNKRNWQSYLMIQLCLVFSNLILFVLYQLGLITHPIISVIAAIVSMATFLSLVIIGDRKAREELRRRFHIRR